MQSRNLTSIYLRCVKHDFARRGHCTVNQELFCFYQYTLKRELKTQHKKIWNLRFHYNTMMLIVIYYAVYIRWLSFYIFVSHYRLRLVCDVTCCIIFIMRLWLLMHNFKATIPIKVNVPDNLLSERRGILDPVSII